jgi:hypothetical protein
VKTLNHHLLSALLLLFLTLGTVTTALAQITPSQDSYTDTSTATTNYGAATTLGVESTAKAIQSSYIQFDLSSIPAGVGIGDSGPNQFIARAAGGFAFYSSSDFSTGATLAAGSGSWSSLSDRNVKTNFRSVDGNVLLQHLAAMPILTWNYKAQPASVQHMGPMAQDFRKAFGLGEDERHIATVDSEGVALAAIQALYRELQQAHEEVTKLRVEVEELRQVRDRRAEIETYLASIQGSR